MDTFFLVDSTYSGWIPSYLVSTVMQPCHYQLFVELLRYTTETKTGILCPGCFDKSTSSVLMMADVYVHLFKKCELTDMIPSISI
jgi:hypothetical protein